MDPEIAGATADSLCSYRASARGGHHFREAQGLTVRPVDPVRGRRDARNCLAVDDPGTEELELLGGVRLVGVERDADAVRVTQDDVVVLTMRGVPLQPQAIRQNSLVENRPRKHKQLQIATDCVLTGTFPSFPVARS